MLRRRRRKLLWQIFPSYLLIIMIPLGAVVVYTSNSLKRFYLQKKREQLESHSRYLISILEERQLFERGPGLKRACDTAAEHLQNRITLILPSGEVIADSVEDPALMENHKRRPEIHKAFRGEVGVSTRYSATLGQDMMYVAVPAFQGETLLGVVRASVSVAELEDALAHLLKNILLAGVFVAILAGGISWVISRRISLPLQSLTRGALRYARGDLEHKVYVSGSEEISTLAESLNQMAIQLGERLRTVTQQHDELDAVLSNMVEAVMIVDREERILRCNRAVGQMFGIEIECVEKRSLIEVIRNAGIQRFVKKTFESREAVADVITLNTGKDQRFLHAHGTLLWRHSPQSAVSLLVFHDITRLKQLENMRRDFVANVSHELKTPITSIEGFIETLQEGAIDEPENARRFLNIIARNAHRLNAIIDDLLTLSKVEQENGKQHILLTNASLQEVLESAMLACEKRAHEQQVHIELECDEGLFAHVNPPLLEQAVVNLVDNAIKYSNPESAVTVSARRQGDELVLQVRDSGCGIPIVHQARIFERFYRVDKARSRKQGGTGLGLAIVKHIANAHNGRATVESTPGKGCTFSIILPLVPALSHETIDAPAASYPMLRR